uniref:condensation domain-containing protein n=1 Tax=Skermania pinensis TaxID=39122 RepID=UPI00278C7C45
MKVRGQRVELGEIEAVVVGLVGVGQAAVSVVDGVAGRRLVGYVVAADAGVGVDVEWVRGEVSQRLPGYMVPEAWVVLAALPLTPSGKLDRAALPVPEVEVAVFRAPTTPVEELVAGVFAEVLGVERVGLDDDFFVLGGNSLVATRVAARLGAALNVVVPVRLLFEVSSVVGLAARVESGLDAVRVPLVARVRSGRVPLSLAQTRMWLLNRLDPGSAAYNIPLVVRLSGVVDVVALGLALGDVVVRHEVLRTVYPEFDGVGYQRVLEPADAVVDVDVVEVSADAVVSVVSEFVGVGFDVTERVPVRARLWRVVGVGVVGDECVLGVVVHHISADGVSVGVLARDVMAAYAARVAGRVPGWAPLAVQYADYSVWQREVLGDEADPESVVARQVGFWRERLAGVPDELGLPLDRSRPVVASGRGGVVRVRWDAVLVAGIAECARVFGVTPFMVVHAGLAVLLARLSGGSDIAIGTPVAGRGEAALDDVVGMFVNTLVLRTEVDLGVSFAGVLAGVREMDVAAFGHADVPFERLVEVLDPPRSRARHPLFQVMLAFQNVADTTFELPGLTVTGV